MIVREIMEAGPVRGMTLLYNATRSGILTEAQFTQCVQSIVAETIVDIEDMEDETVMLTSLLSSSGQIATC